MSNSRNVAFDFADCTVLVTGATKGIGHAIAKGFAGAGARVVVWDVDGNAAHAAWKGSDVMVDQVDVSDAGQVSAAIERIVAEHGSVDVAVNNAGITRDGVVWRLGDNDWHTVVDVHLTGTFNVTRAVVPHMRKASYGRIINVTSYTGMHGTIGQSNYAAAKGGIIAFTRTVAKETARFGITANAISPNAMTDMVAAVPDDRLEAMTASIPMERFADPVEMAPATMFLASADAAYITGVVLPVDGGISM